MPSYREEWLDMAMENLGEAFDYAANCCGLDLDLFLSLLISSGLAHRFEQGDPAVIAGISGTELTRQVLFGTGMREDFPPAQIEYTLSRQYWCGWVLAFCQWRSGRSFADIRRHVSMRELEGLYDPWHEASEERFADFIDERIAASGEPIALQRLRIAAGLTQRELANRAGVNLRTLQQYESRAKDIRKAAGITLLSLSRTLGCAMEDLMA